MKARERADGLITSSIGLIEGRLRALAGGSFENPKTASAWRLDSVRQFFGSREAPKPGRFFADPDLCMYGLTEPCDPDGYWKKSLVLAATYEEIMQVNRHCVKFMGEAMRKRIRVRGTCPAPLGTGDRRVWKDRSALSAWYPLELGLAWGRAIAKACFRLCAHSAESWATTELERSQQDSDSQGRVALDVKLEKAEGSYAVWQPGTPIARSGLGVAERLYAFDAAEDAAIAPAAVADKELARKVGQSNWA